MFALVIEPEVMSIYWPDCCEPFWEPTTVRTLTLASPHLCSASHRLACEQKTYFKHISFSPAPPSFLKSSTPPTYLSYSIPSPSIHVQAFPVLKKKEETPLSFQIVQ